jgi:cytosine/adenosine deaminase-related metal-dependent hydrolase
MYSNFPQGHFIGPSDMMNQMRLALQLARQDKNQQIFNGGIFPLTYTGSSAQLFKLGTIVGARAVQMDSQIGSIALGKFANIVIFDTTSPTMICAAQQDPDTAVVRHASIRDVDTVIIDGVIRKRHGKVLPVKIDDGSPRTDSSEFVWDQISSKLIHSRNEIIARIGTLHMEAGKAGLEKLYRLDKSRLVA